MSSNSLALKPIYPATKTRWEHFKGNQYVIIRIARDCEDPNRFLVVYEDDHGEVWVRELTNFLGTHENGKKRFTEI